MPALPMGGDAQERIAEMRRKYGRTRVDRGPINFYGLFLGRNSIDELFLRTAELEMSLPQKGCPRTRRARVISTRSHGDAMGGGRPARTNL